MKSSTDYSYITLESLKYDEVRMKYQWSTVKYRWNTSEVGWSTSEVRLNRHAPNPGDPRPGTDRTREHWVRDTRSVPGFGTCLNIGSFRIIHHSFSSFYWYSFFRHSARVYRSTETSNSCSSFESFFVLLNYSMSKISEACFD